MYVPAAKRTRDCLLPRRLPVSSCLSGLLFSFSLQATRRGKDVRILQTSRRFLRLFAQILRCTYNLLGLLTGPKLKLSELD